jgi:hypothetical protein
MDHANARVDDNNGRLDPSIFKSDSSLQALQQLFKSNNSILLDSEFFKSGDYFKSKDLIDSLMKSNGDSKLAEQLAPHQQGSAAAAAPYTTTATATTTTTAEQQQQQSQQTIPAMVGFFQSKDWANHYSNSHVDVDARTVFQSTNDTTAKAVPVVKASTGGTDWEALYESELMAPATHALSSPPPPAYHHASVLPASWQQANLVAQTAPTELVSQGITNKPAASVELQQQPMYQPPLRETQNDASASDFQYSHHAGAGPMDSLHHTLPPTIPPALSSRTTITISDLPVSWQAALLAQQQAAQHQQQQLLHSHAVANPARIEHEPAYPPHSSRDTYNDRDVYHDDSSESTAPKRKRPAVTKTSNTRRNKEPEVKLYFEPADDDILLGRGGRTNHHPGNKRYLLEKGDIQDRYLAATKQEKTFIAQELVDRVHAWGGKFLAMEETTKQWYQVSPIKARKKASQTLRERNTAEERLAKRLRYGK